jgi:hypothetical protein
MATKHDPVRVRIMMFKPTHDILEFMQFIQDHWEYYDSAEIIDKGDHYTFRLVTVGMSSNEKIVRQLMSSFFRIYWKKSTSSGKHIFKINKDGSVYFKPLNKQQ